MDEAVNSRPQAAIFFVKFDYLLFTSHLYEVDYRYVFWLHVYN